MKCLTCKYCDLYVGDEISLKGITYCSYFVHNNFPNAPIFIEIEHTNIAPYILRKSDLLNSEFCTTYNEI